VALSIELSILELMPVKKMDFCAKQTINARSERVLDTPLARSMIMSEPYYFDSYIDLTASTHKDRSMSVVRLKGTDSVLNQSDYHEHRDGAAGS
jgi:hypothetical protein